MLGAILMCFTRDCAQDYHTIYKLCYTDLQDAAQQAALSHIAAEGRRAYEEFAARLPNGPPGISLKVLDIAFQSCSGQPTEKPMIGRFATVGPLESFLRLFLLCRLFRILTTR